MELSTLLISTLSIYNELIIVIKNAIKSTLISDDSLLISDSLSKN